MDVVYVHTSALAAVLLNEPPGNPCRDRLHQADRLIASNLLEVELRALLVREGVAYDDSVVQGLSWILPQRPLTPEIAKVLTCGSLPSPDLWHLACALYVVNRPDDLTFLTLDQRQHGAAKTLGFR